VVAALSIIAVRGGNADFLVGLVPSLSLSTLESPALKPSRSLLISVRVLSDVMRASRPAVRPIVLPVVSPTVPRVVAFSSPSLAVLPAPIVLPIRDVEFLSCERCVVAACLFDTDIDGSVLPITLPMLRLRSLRDAERLLLILGVVELTAGCVASDRAEELRVPIKSPIREVLSERAAGCSAPLGTDGLVVLMLFPIREVMLGLILLLSLVFERFVITLLELLKFKLLLLELLTLDVPLLELFLLVITLLELLLSDGVIVLIELPIREVMLELILPFELLGLLMLLLLERFEIEEFD